MYQHTGPWGRTSIDDLFSAVDTFREDIKQAGYNVKKHQEARIAFKHWMKEAGIELYEEEVE